jgi:foldase protein PrsA
LKDKKIKEKDEEIIEDDEEIIEEKKETKRSKKNTKKEKKSKYPKGFFMWMFFLFVIVASLVFYNYDMFFNQKDVVANVNGEKIFYEDLDVQYQRLPDMYKPFMTKESLLERIINFVVLRQASENEGIKITENEVDLVVKYLSYYLTDEEFEKEINSYGSLELFKRELKETMQVQAFVSDNVFEFMFNEDELMDMYEQYNEILNSDYFRASHIIICHDGSDSCPSNITKEQALEKITEIKNNLTKDNFAEMARNYSNDGSAEVGGDLGWFTQGEMVKEFEDVIFSLNEGEISEIVETEFGYHLILLVAKKEAIEITFEEIKPFIKFTVFNQIQQNANEAFIEFALELREDANIEIYLPEDEQSGIIIEDVQLVDEELNDEELNDEELNDNVTVLNESENIIIEIDDLEEQIEIIQEIEKCLEIDEDIIFYYMDGNERSLEMKEIVDDYDNIFYLERSEDTTFIDICINNFRKTIVPQIICTNNNELKQGLISEEEFINFINNC